MIKNLLFICLTFFKICGYSQGFVATYGFQDVSTSTGKTDPSITPSVTGLTFGSFRAEGTSVNPGASGRFSFTGWPLGGVNGTDDYTNFTGALSPTVYYQVTLAVNPGYTLTLNTVTFSVRRSGTGTRNYCVRSDLDSYTNNMAAATGTNTKLSVLPGDVFFWNYDSVSTSNDQRGSTILAGSRFSAVTGSVTFHFYAWNAESNGGSFSIDNVTFSGSVLDSLTASDPVGLTEQVYSGSSVKLYPNPSAGQLTVETGESALFFQVLTATGEVVLIKQTGEKDKITSLDLSALKNGFYFVKVISSKGSSVHKLILEHK